MEGQTSAAPSIAKAEVEQMMAAHEQQLEINVNKIIDDKLTLLQQGLVQAASTLTVKPAEPPKKGLPINGFLDLARFFSTQASASNRSLALGGIAIVWLFKKPGASLPIEKGLLNMPLLFLALSLTLDLLQYFIGAAGWNTFYGVKFKAWKKKGFEATFASDIETSDFISVPITTLFYLKIISTGVAYYFILSYLWTVL